MGGIQRQDKFFLVRPGFARAIRDKIPYAMGDAMRS